MTKQIKLEDAVYAELNVERRKDETRSDVVSRLLRMAERVRQASAVYDGERQEYEPPKPEA